MNERTELFRDQAGSIVEAYSYLSGILQPGIQAKILKTRTCPEMRRRVSARF